MPENERYCKIVEPAPSYKKDEQAPNADKQKIKLILAVELSDGRRADYYMNRTSARAVAGLLKTDLSAEGMKKWVGHSIVWGKILDQMIGGQAKKVLYVTHLREALNTNRDSNDNQPVKSDDPQVQTSTEEGV